MSTGTITNTIKDPSGTAVPGVVVNARLMPGQGFRNVAPFSEVSQLESTTTDSNGAWSLTLEINTDITPGDTYYEIEEQIPPAWGIPSLWSIQVASGSHTLYASLVATPPATSVPSYITQSSGDARYAPLGGGGGTSISYGVTVTLVGTSTATGTNTTVARSDHQHALSSTVVGWGLSLNAGVLSVNSNSMSTTITVPTVGALPTVVGTNTVTGTSTQYAPANHGHQLSPDVVGSGLALASGVLSVTTVVPVVGASPTAVGTNTVTGTATTFAPANHGHQLSPAVVGNDLVIAAGVLSVSPRVPVVGGLTTAVDTATATGTATTYAASNHQHTLSPGVVGADLLLTSGVLSVSPRVPTVGALPQALSTTTITGTATQYAPANHSHVFGPAQIGSGLTLSAGVISATGGAVPVGGDEIRAVSTGTSTGTTTTFARTNHQHTYDPGSIGQGLLLASGVLKANVRGATYQVFTATATAVYTTPSGATAIIIDMVGAGGGGGACPGSLTQSAGGGGGASGGFLRKVFTATATAYTYTVGTKGAGGAAGSNAGGTGGNTTFGTTLTAFGGGGGTAGVLGTTGNYDRGGIPGAVSTGGDINGGGQPGQMGASAAGSVSIAGAGGGSTFGGGGGSQTGNGDGSAATGPGSGGGGACVASVNTARAGGNGADGQIFVLEIYGN